MSRVFMLFLCCLLLSTPAFSQGNHARITIHKKNISVIEALKEVEKQTKLSVGYNESQLINKPSIDLALEKATLETSLKEILKGTGYTYQLKGKYVIIVPEEKKVTEPVICQADHRTGTGRAGRTSDRCKRTCRRYDHRSDHQSGR